MKIKNSKLNITLVSIIIAALALLLTYTSCNEGNVNDKINNTSLTTVNISNASIYSKVGGMELSWRRGYNSIQELLEDDGVGLQVSLVVIGTFEKVLASNEAYTTYQFNIEKYIVGESNEEIAVIGLGNIDGAQVPEDPLPGPGERFLLFLTQQQDNNEYYYWWGGPWFRFQILDGKVYALQKEHINWATDNINITDGVDLDSFIDNVTEVSKTIKYERAHISGGWEGQDRSGTYDYADIIALGTFDKVVNTMHFEGHDYTRFSFKIDEVIKGNKTDEVIIEYIGLLGHPETQVELNPLPELAELPQL